jgi:hypothetical protein
MHVWQNRRVPFWNEDPRFSDPILGPVMRQIVQERFAGLFSRTKTPEESLGRLIVPVGSNYRTARNICVTVSMLLAVATIFCFGRAHWLVFLVGCSAVTAGGSVWVALLFEISENAGQEVHRSYRTDTEWTTSRHFEPFISTLSGLMAVLCTGLIAVILGFGLCFWHISVSQSGFSQPLSATSALYLSLVTFATVGFGDLTPLSDFARVMISLEIVASLFALAAVFSVTFSWIAAAQQRRYEAFVNRLEAEHIRYDEEARRLKAGEYVDVDEIVEEARKRLDRQTTA